MQYTSHVHEGMSMRRMCTHRIEDVYLLLVSN